MNKWLLWTVVFTHWFPFLFCAEAFSLPLEDDPQAAINWINEKRADSADQAYQLAVQIVQSDRSISDLHKSLLMLQMSAIACDQRNKKLSDSLSAAALEIYSNDSLLASAQNLHGRNLSHRGDYDSAIIVFKDVLKKYRTLHNKREEAAALQNIGTMYRILKENEIALEYHFQSLAIRQEHEHKKLTQYNYINMSLIYTNMGLLEEADKAINKAIGSIYELDSFHADLPFALNAKGLIYKNLRQYDDAIIQYKKGLEVIQRRPFPAMEAAILLNTGRAYMEKKDYNSAIEYLFRARKINHEIKRNKGLAICNSNIGSAYTNTGKTDSAAYYLGLAQAYYEAQNDQAGLKIMSKHWANLYTEKKDFPRVIDYLSWVTDTVGWQQSALVFSGAPLMLAKAYEGINDFKKANELHKFNTMVDDYIRSNETRVSIETAALRERLEAKNLQLADLADQNEKLSLQTDSRQKNIIRLLVALGLLTLSGSVVLLLLSKRLKRSKMATRLAEEQLDESLKRLNLSKETQAQLVAKINDLSNGSRDAGGQKLTAEELKRFVVDSDVQARDFETFFLFFDKHYPGFRNRLKQQYDKLTSNEIRICCLLSLNLSTKEIASLLSISYMSANTARYRIRKKMGLKREQSLADVLLVQPAG